MRRPVFRAFMANFGPFVPLVVIWQGMVMLDIWPRSFLPAPAASGRWHHTRREAVRMAEQETRLMREAAWRWHTWRAEGKPGELDLACRLAREALVWVKTSMHALGTTG